MVRVRVLDFNECVRIVLAMTGLQRKYVYDKCMKAFRSSVFDQSNIMRIFNHAQAVYDNGLGNRE